MKLKYFIFFLTLLTVSHHAHGAESTKEEDDIFSQEDNNLWYSIVNLSQCDPQNMKPQEALEACKKADASFSFDDCADVWQDDNRMNILHFAIINEKIDDIEFIFANIREKTKKNLLYTPNISDWNNSFHFACQGGNTKIIKCILDQAARISPLNESEVEALDPRISPLNESKNRALETPFDLALKHNNIDLITLIVNHQSFDPNDKNNFFQDNFLLHFIKQQINLAVKNQHHSEELCLPYNQNYIQEAWTNLSDHIQQTFKAIIDSNKCNADTLEKTLQYLLEQKIEQKKRKESTVSIIDALIIAIIQNKNFNLEHFLIEERDWTKIENFLELFPNDPFKDNGQIDIFFSNSLCSLEVNESWNIIQRFIDHGMRSINPKNFKQLKTYLKENPSDKKTFDLNQLTIYSWTPIRSCTLAGISIATILYDFIRFKKPENKDAKIDTKGKASIKLHAKKATEAKVKEPKQRSRFERLIKHTKNYKKDLLKNPRNHKKLAIPVACLLLRLFKDKIPHVQMI